MCAPGTEGCPCGPGNSCDVPLTCQNGYCIDPYPDCGNGTIDANEECDDGNQEPGDGCGFDCLMEDLCVIGHLGGNPAIITSVRVSKNGTLSLVDTLSTGADHTPYTWDGLRQGITSCARRVYAAMEGNGVIRGADVAMDGTLSAIAGLPSQSSVVGLLCDPAAGLLFGFAQTTTVGVVSYAIQPAGTLTQQDTDTLVYPMSPLERAYFARHPSLPQFYVSAAGGNMPQVLEASRVSYDAAGTLTQEQHPVNVGQTGAYGLRISPSAEYLAFVAYSGGCFAWHTLPPGGGIPPAANLVVTCSGGIGNGNDIAMRGNDVFYYSHSDTTVTIGEFLVAGLTIHGTVDAVGSRNHLLLAYGGDMLIAASNATGEITTFSIDNTQIGLTQLDSYATGAVDTYQASVLVPCPG
jgi:cysteine-rich repeat protein